MQCLAHQMERQPKRGAGCGVRGAGSRVAAQAPSFSAADSFRPAWAGCVTARQAGRPWAKSSPVLLPVS